MQYPIKSKESLRTVPTHSVALVARAFGAAVILPCAVFCASIALTAHEASGDRVIGPSLGDRAAPYPPAFISFMETNYGRMWMHTVQEQVVRRMYVAWLLKNYK